MLLETAVYLQPIYLTSWGALGFAFGLIACIVLASKGHGGEAVAAFLLGLVCFPMGLISLIVAFTRPDKKQLEAQHHKEFADRRRFQRQQQQINALHRQVAQFGQCPQCGQSVAFDAAECWNCHVRFEQAAPPTVQAPPPRRRPR